MATLSFEGATQAEIVQQVRHWLSSTEGQAEGSRLTPTEVISQGAVLTKEALRVIAQAAPAPVAQSELFKALTGLGYKATDAAKDALVDKLDSLDEVTGGSVVQRVTDVGRSAVYSMSEQVAKQILRSLTQR